MSSPTAHLASRAACTMGLATVPSNACQTRNVRARHQTSLTAFCANRLLYAVIALQARHAASYPNRSLQVGRAVTCSVALLHSDALMAPIFSEMVRSGMSDAEHIQRNQRYWNEQARAYASAGEANWARTEPDWGIFGVPESTLRMLPQDMRPMKALELGCGTAYISAWMARRGAHVTGIDLSERQLETARGLQQVHNLSFDLVHGNCEELPFADSSFDFVISEYGAAIWCQPERWLREAFRVTKAGGALHFLGCSPWVYVCSPASGELPLVERMEHSYFDQYMHDWGEEGVNFNLPLSAWFRLFHDIGWQVIDYLEPRPKSPGPERKHHVTLDWSYRYPAEQVWKLAKPTSHL